MRPSLVYSIVVLLLTVTTTCFAADQREDHVHDQASADDDDEYDGDADDRQPSPSSAPLPPPPPPSRQDDMNKCVDPNSGLKYVFGATWSPADGCGRRTCIYSAEYNRAEVRVESCTCKECPTGLQCSVLKRKERTDVNFPGCCPKTVCVPASGNKFWAYFKGEYIKDTFVKIQKKLHV